MSGTWGWNITSVGTPGHCYSTVRNILAHHFLCTCGPLRQGSSFKSNKDNCWLLLWYIAHQAFHLSSAVTQLNIIINEPKLLGWKHQENCRAPSSVCRSDWCLLWPVWTCSSGKSMSSTSSLSPRSPQSSTLLCEWTSPGAAATSSACQHSRSSLCLQAFVIQCLCVTRFTHRHCRGSQHTQIQSFRSK